MRIIFSTSQNNEDLGGKANQLFTLTNIGMNVPKFIVLPYSYLQTFIDINTTEAAQLHAIANVALPDEDRKTISAYLAANRYAVRSSGIGEDGKQYSFAGQYETVLNVSDDLLDDAIRKVWKSAYDERVKLYRHQNQLAQHVRINIIIQVMVDSYVSGVAFGINPLTGNANEMVINSLWGLGEGLVGGILNADEFIVQKNGEIVKNIALKEQKMVAQSMHGVMVDTVEESLKKIQSLSDGNIELIKKIVNKLTTHYCHPQDIEFAFDKAGSFYLLQSRPITISFGKTLQVYDNSNIIESYPGITSPLTYSFIQKMYEAVYIQLSQLLGVRQDKIEMYSNVYANMLCQVKGRVYYQLNNWYMNLALLPGYQLNARFMEKMMGVKESFDIDMPKASSKIKAYWDITYACRKILVAHNSIKKERVRFLKYFNDIHDQYVAIDFSTKTIDELIDLYKTYENTMVTKWKAPLVNDFFAMIYFGMLQKAIIKYNIPNPETIHNELLAGSGDILSTEPATLLMEITKQIKADNVAFQFFTTHEAMEVWQGLINGKCNAIKKLIDVYLFKWGARCVAELKLETITYNQQPWVFVSIVQNHLKIEEIVRDNATRNVAAIRSNAEKIAFSRLKGLKKRWFKYVLNKTRDLVSNRENLRYQRTKGFSMVRNLFMAIGEQLHQQQLLDDSRDIFWLTQQEVFTAHDGKWRTSLKEIIVERKLQFASWEAQTVPERLYAYGNVHSQYFTKPKQALVEGDLKGIPCCAGIVRKRVCVLHSPLEMASLQGDILVTTSTDPGWVTLFPSASGILVERGSLLSHSAIVSREMGIPCIVGITGLLESLQTGDEVEMDGATGVITIINSIKP